MIRFAEITDVPQMLAIYAPFIENTTTSFEYTVPTIEAFEKRFLEKTEQFPWLVWEEDGQVLGYAYGSAPFERAAYGWCAELSIYLHPNIHGRGIGRKLYAVAEELLRLQGYFKVFAIVTSENLSSVSFHEAVGYTVTARFPNVGFKFGRWIGTIWLEKMLNFGEMPTCAPVSIHHIVKNNRNLAEVLDKMPLS